MPDHDKLIEIQRHGANARARGESYFDNPYLKSANMPAATGDSPREWSAKHANWEIGWRAEDLMRSSSELTLNRS